MSALARRFLETGLDPMQSGKEAQGEPWPLSRPEAPARDRRERMAKPYFDVLVEIAIQEKKPDEVVKWYDRSARREGERGFRGSVPNQEVAEAVKDKYPDRAIVIWNDLARRQIALVNAKGYDAAAPFIRKIRALLFKLGRGKE